MVRLAVSPPTVNILSTKCIVFTVAESECVCYGRVDLGRVDFGTTCCIASPVIFGVGAPVIPGAAIASLKLISNDLIDEIILPFGYEFIVKVERYDC